MKPITPKFDLSKSKWTFVTYAENQPEYLSLPSFRSPEGNVISCWALTWRERIAVLLFGRMFFEVLTFNMPLQPQRPCIFKREIQRWIES